MAGASWPLGTGAQRLPAVVQGEARVRPWRFRLPEPRARQTARLRLSQRHGQIPCRVLLRHSLRPSSLSLGRQRALIRRCKRRAQNAALPLKIGRRAEALELREPRRVLFGVRSQPASASAACERSAHWRREGCAFTRWACLVVVVVVGEMAGFACVP